MKSKKDIINCLKKRDILNNNGIDTEALVRFGNSFFEMELYNDAIDFFEKSNYQDGLKNIKEIAIETGDLFLYRRCCKALKLAEEREELQRLAENAKDSGKLMFASQAYTALGDREKAEALKSILTPETEVAGEA